MNQPNQNRKTAGAAADAAAPTMPRRAGGQHNAQEAAPQETPQAPMPDPVSGQVGADTAPAQEGGAKPRRSFGEARYRMRLPPRPGFFRYWFNDTPGRIDDAIEAGYTHIKDRDGKPLSIRAGVAPTGGPLLSYAMEIPEALREEDRQAQFSREATIEQAMRGGLKDPRNPDDANRYVADHLGGTNIRHAGRR